MRKYAHYIGPAVTVALFAVTLWVMHDVLKEYRFRDVMRHIHELPADRFALALLFTAISYFALTCYDMLAMRYINRPIAYSKVGVVAFIGYAFSNTIGYSVLSGGTVRYRMYSVWGLTTFDVTRIVAFNGLTLWMGTFTLGGFALLLEPMSLPGSIHLPAYAGRALGVVFLSIVAAALTLSTLRLKPLKLRDWEFPVPSPTLVMGQIVLACVDLTVAAAVLFMLIPASPDLSFTRFLAMFVLALVAGLVSQVPGGAGVIEAIVLVMLPESVPRSGVLGGLLVFRAIYYLLPLSIAAAMLGIHELVGRREQMRWVVRFFGQWVPGFLPHVFALTTFASGAVLLFSSSTPMLPHRLLSLERVIPLPVVELSHFLGSLAGAMLLLLSRGLQRRLSAAYWMTMVMLAAGSIFSLLKGFDYEEALVLFVMLLTLAPCQKAFYRKAALFEERFSPGWVVAVLLVIASTLWLGNFSYKHVEYSHELWWQFAFRGDAPRFMRAIVGVMGLIMVVAAHRLLRPAPAEPTLPTVTDLDHAAEVAAQSPQTSAYIALLGDKEILFSKSGDAFLTYAVEKRTWVALGDPVGPTDAGVELAWTFREICDRHDGWPVFYEIGTKNMPIYLDLGLSFLKLGEEARVHLPRFSLEGRPHKEKRYTLRKLESQGMAFEVVPANQVDTLLPLLKTISDEWLAQKATREKGFSLGFFKEDYLRRFPMAIVRERGQIVAFANIWPGGERHELSVDLMRYLPEHSSGLMDYLFTNLMLYGKQEGYEWFNLGMAPLSGLERHELAPLWHRLGALVFRHGEHFYNFQGLRQYKQKFDPVWTPRYLASPGGLRLPQILTSVATLISGGIKGVFTK